MNKDLIILTDYIEVKLALSQYNLQKQADDTLGDLLKQHLSSIPKQLLDYALDLFDPKHPVASLINIAMPRILSMIPGIGWAFGFLWTAAEAFGFDGAKFVSELGDKLTPILEEAFKNKNIDPEKVKKAAEEAASASFTNPVDEKKVEQVADKMSNASNKNSIIKLGGIFDWIFKSPAKKMLQSEPVKKSIIGKLIGYIGIVIGFIFSGLFKTVSVAAVPAFFGHEPGAELGKTREETKRDRELENHPQIKIEPAPEVDSEYLKYHQNSGSFVWIEDIPYNDIEKELKKWTVDIYPQLKGKENEFNKSSAFNKMVDFIKQNNKGLAGFKGINIPNPYTRKLDIVNTFVQDLAHLQQEKPNA